MKALGKKDNKQNGTLLAFADCTATCQAYSPCVGCTTAKPQNNVYLEYFSKNLSTGMSMSIWG